MAEVGLGRRETASKVGSRPLDSPTSSSSSPGPVNFEEAEEVSALHSRERERFLRCRVIRLISGISFISRDSSLVKHTRIRFISSMMGRSGIFVSARSRE